MLFDGILIQVLDNLYKSTDYSSYTKVVNVTIT